tara:strand:- start:2078 stop:3262 length:1185 start_codon:yes stop_codon:yes gene_type:complete
MHGLMNGPLNKSIHTQKYELFIKCALHAENKINYTLENNIQGKENLYATVGNIKINISELTQKANLNHITLDAHDAEKFTAKYAHNDFGYYGYRYNSNTDPKYSAINEAERTAIQNYTGSEYASINSFLYGKTGRIHPDFYNDNGINNSANKLLLNTAFLSSGLNKIMPEVDYSGQTFRGESSTSFEEIEHRMALINSDFPVSENLAFISTSFDSYIGDAFSNGSLITFDGAYGKDISGLSHFESECELLVLPNQLLWEHCEYKEGTYYFKASVVAPLIEGKDESSQAEITEFKQLVDFANEHNIDTSFITEFNQTQIQAQGQDAPYDLINLLAELFPETLIEKNFTPNNITTSSSSPILTTVEAPSSEFMEPQHLLPIHDELAMMNNIIMCDC